MSDRVKLRWIDDHMTSHRVGASVTGTDPATAPGGSVSPADAPATPDPRLVQALTSMWPEGALPDGALEGIVAWFVATGPGASLLADAAVGRAVREALDMVDSEGDYLCWTLYRGAQGIVAEDVDRNLSGGGSTIPEAIAAALGIQADIEVKAQRNAAEQDAARLAEALRTAPVAVEQTPQTAAWEVQRHRALAVHRERTDPGPIGTLDVDEGER